MGEENSPENVNINFHLIFKNAVFLSEEKLCLEYNTYELCRAFVF